MNKFIFDLPTKIYFGNDIVKEALYKEHKWINGIIMIVTTGRSLIRYGYLNELVDIIISIPDVEEVVIYDRISANPKLEEVEDAVRLGKTKGVTAIIGFGGGSALDAAKAAAVGIGTSISLEEYLLDGKEPPKGVLPIIAIPTTAGTGSELSKGAILSSIKHHIKAGIRGENLLPKAAIVNPVYTWTVPENITMETGFDALGHAVESYVAVKSNKLSEMISESVIKTIAKNLQLLSENIDNYEAREDMSYASMIIGINLANVGTCLPHRMQYAVGAQTDTSHGAGIAALYPAWIEEEYRVSIKKIENIIYWISGDVIQSGLEAKDKISYFMKKINVFRSLASLGIKGEDIATLTEQVTGNISNDKLSKQENIIKIIFEASLNIN